MINLIDKILNSDNIQEIKKNALLLKRYITSGQFEKNISEKLDRITYNLRFNECCRRGIVSINDERAGGLSGYLGNNKFMIYRNWCLKYNCKCNKRNCITRG